MKTMAEVKKRAVKVPGSGDYLVIKSNSASACIDVNRRKSVVKSRPRSADINP